MKPSPWGKEKPKEDLVFFDSETVKVYMPDWGRPMLSVCEFSERETFDRGEVRFDNEQELIKFLEKQASISSQIALDYQSALSAARISASDWQRRVSQ